MFHNIVRIGGAAIASFAMAQGAYAADAQFSQGTIRVVPSKSISNVTLMVSGPNGYYTEEFTKDGLPRVDLVQFGKLEDGVYRWQITGATKEKRAVHKSELYNGRDENARPNRMVGLRENGAFYVKGGEIIQVDPDAEEPTKKKG